MHQNSSTAMAELSNDREIKKQADEEALFETVLHDSDRLLRDSLREDDRRRRRRRRMVVSLFGGVLVMGTVLIAALAGWLTMFSPPPDGAGTKAEAKKSHLSQDAQIERGEEIAKQGWALFQQGK